MGRCLRYTVLVGLSALGAGCNPAFVANQTAELSGNFRVVFVNTTPFRASFSFGSYNALDRSPGEASLNQLRLEANRTSTPTEVPCRRNFAIGTAEYIQRVIDTRADQNAASFDPDAFDEDVHFSSAPADSDAAALPTEGFARGREFLVGVHYTCGDELIVTFSQDATAPGGFRIDLVVVSDDPRR